MLKLTRAQLEIVEIFLIKNKATYRKCRIGNALFSKLEKNGKIEFPKKEPIYAKNVVCYTKLDNLAQECLVFEDGEKKLFLKEKINSIEQKINSWLTISRKKIKKLPTSLQDKAVAFGIDFALCELLEDLCAYDNAQGTNEAGI